eukprot:TRINITY_DN93154_c0_g1_i1.p1 TRINITY_DN93154_c0_g1~~TRINITY_DN93154_c0_g1_i1.p1  ORF type:complete len:573 (+),score=69.68 TRINITY_DN93154_c0_g1_i1:82-1800(+)
MLWPRAIPELLLICFASLAGLASAQIHRVSALCDATAAVSCEVVLGYDADAAAWGEFEDSIDTQGFGLLRIAGREGLDPKTMCYAAGVVEGAITAVRTSQHVNNSLSAEFEDAPALWIKAKEFLEDNDNYVREMVAAKESSSNYWYHISLIWAQLDGLLAGHNLARAGGWASNAAPLTRTHLLFVNALVDLSTVISKPFASDDVARWTAEEVAAMVDRETHCSAIVKLSADFSELWTAHNTWTQYFTMLRVAKLYDLPLPGSARRAAFPGYFGTLSSSDDLFVLSSGLVVQETTNAVFPPRKGMYSPRAVLTWARTVLANRLGTDGRSWTEWFARENSGTINNQWMVVDYNKFVPKQPLKAGTLWVLEQLPLYIEKADMTHYLQIGHWPSFNQPFFPAVRNLSGNDAMMKRFGLQYSYDLNPRAKIFRRDAPAIQTREELRAFMRYNNWQHDPFSAAGYGGPAEPHSPENAIAARNDLIPKGSSIPQQAANRGVHGNTDGKLVGRQDVLHLTFDFVVGPTSDTQPPFSWGGEWGMVPEGQPKRFNFSWQSVNFSRLGSSGLHALRGSGEVMI